MDFSYDIKKLREKLMVSQKELADLLGVSFETVNRWENKHHKPTYRCQRKLKNLYAKNDLGDFIND